MKTKAHIAKVNRSVPLIRKKRPIKTMTYTSSLDEDSLMLDEIINEIPSADIYCRCYHLMEVV